MSKETIQDLIESVIENKPRDTKEIFNTLMAEKIREAVAQHAEVVAESFFDESEELEEMDSDEDRFPDEDSVHAAVHRGTLDPEDAEEHLKRFRRTQKHSAKPAAKGAIPEGQ